MKDILRRIGCILVCFALVVSNFSGINVEAAVYSANGTNIIYDGEGKISKTLSNGKFADVTVNDSVINITVGGERYGYYSQICVATCVISEDDLLHIFWHTGDYYVYDLYESGMFLRAYKSTGTQSYCSEETSDAYAVNGSSTANVAIHSCIIDGKYFYQYGKVGKKLLMTRKEFQNIVNPTVEPTEMPTVEPTLMPTVEPTVMPTVEPTVMPTVEPTQIPTATPVIEINNKTEFNFEFWWKMYVDGTITWEQFKEIMWEYHWTTNSQATENSTTYYFYDSEGKLIRTETITISNKTENGAGSGNATEESKGKEEIDIDVEGKGEASGVVESDTDIFINVTSAPVIKKTPAPNKTALSVGKTVVVLKAGTAKTITYSAKNSKGKAVRAKVKNSSNVASATVVSNNKIKITASKSAANCTYSTVTVTNGSKKVAITVIVSNSTKPHARVVTSGSRIKIFQSNNKLYGWLLFNRKTGKLDWNGYKMKNVKSCGFIQGSWNVIVLMNDGTLYKLPKRAKKGQTVHKTKIKCEKGIALNRDSYGFVKYVKTSCGGLKNVSGK